MDTTLKFNYIILLTILLKSIVSNPYCSYECIGKNHKKEVNYLCSLVFTQVQVNTLNCFVNILKYEFVCL